MKDYKLTGKGENSKFIRITLEDEFRDALKAAGMRVSCITLAWLKKYMKYAFVKPMEPVFENTPDFKFPMKVPPESLMNKTIREYFNRGLLQQQCSVSLEDIFNTAVAFEKMLQNNNSESLPIPDPIKVTFTGNDGYPAENEKARTVFTIGNEYVVDVGSTSSTMRLMGVPGDWNTAFFKVKPDYADAFMKLCGDSYDKNYV